LRSYGVSLDNQVSILGPELGPDLFETKYLLFYSPKDHIISQYGKSLGSGENIGRTAKGVTIID